MVKRFASGDSELKQSEVGRYNRGAPRTSPIKSPTASTNQQQQQPSISKEQRIEQRAQELALEAIERKLRGQRISFYTDKSDRSEEALAKNRAKDIYAQLAKRPDISSALQDAAAKKIKAQELGFGQNVQEYESAQGFVKQKPQPKQKVTDLGGGSFAVTRKIAGREETRYFDETGAEIYPQSGIGMTSRQAVARDFFIKTGILKEKVAPTSFNEVSPLPSTIIQAKSSHPQQFASGDVIIQNVRASTPRARFDFTQEYGLTTKQIIGQRFKQVGVGITQAGIGVAEGFGVVALSFNPGVNNPSYKIGTVPIAPKFALEDLKINQRTKQLIVDIKQAPTGTGTFLGKSLVYLPLIGAGIASTTINIQQLGFKEGLKATAAGFSPLRIKPGVYGPIEGPKAQTIKFDAVAVTKTKGITTTRLVIGQDTERAGASLISRQQFAKVGNLDVGGARTTVQAPTITITPGGSIVPGQRILTVDSAIVGKIGNVRGVAKAGGFVATTKGLPVGFVGRVATITRADLLLTDVGNFGTLNIGPTGTRQTTVGGFSVTTPKTNVKLFAAGEGTRFLRISKTNINEVVKVSNFKIRGIELEAPASSQGFKSFGTGPSQKIVQQSVELTAAAVNIKPSATTPKGSQVFPTVIKLSSPKQINQQTQTRQTQALQTRQIPKLESLTTTVQAQRSKTISVQSLQSLSTSLQTSKTIPALLTTPSQNQQTRTRQALRLSNLTNINPTTSTPPFISTPSRAPPAFGPLIFANPKAGRSTKGLFIIETRRAGIFRPVARAGSARQALRLGAIITGNTLAASFKIKGPRQLNLAAPRGFKKKREKGDLIFIENKNLRLSKPGEIRSIQASKIKLPKLSL